MPRKSKSRASSALSPDQPLTINYRPGGPVLRAFHQSDAFVRVIRGPFGSGKSTACSIEPVRRAREQWPQADGIRRSRIAICRGTYPELRSTTMNTWLDWFPEDRFGRVAWTPPFEQLLKIGDVELHAYFFALDDEKSVKKLLSLELTYAWINEVREVPKAVLDGLTGRVGRYPSERDGGARWAGIWCDTNPPDESHYLSIMAGWAPVPEWMSEEDRRLLVKPKDWEFFVQPPAVVAHRDEASRIKGFSVNPEAENLANLRANYYEQQLGGKKLAWVRVYLMNEIGVSEEGKPVYNNYRRDLHVAREPLEASPHLPIILMVDYGLTGACLIGQETPLGQLLILDEIHANGRGARRFAADIKRYLLTKHPHLAGAKTLHPGLVRGYGDPAGDNRAQTDEDTPSLIFRGAGLTITATSTNDIGIRTDAVEERLGTLTEGRPRLLIDPRCQMLIMGLEGKYIYARRPGALHGEDYEEVPKKDRYSHVQDALQYGVLGLGGQRVVMGRPKDVKHDLGRVQTRGSVWDRQTRMRQRRAPPGARAKP